MPKEKKVKFKMEAEDLKRMSDEEFKWMLRSYRVMDIFWNPKRKIKKIPLKERMRVVDYGCGIGRYTLPIAKLVGPEGKIFAVDICPPAIKHVKEMAVKENLKNVEAILAEKYDTGIQESSIDLVLLIDTFHMIDDRDALFHEIHRMLKKDGLLFMDPGHMKMSQARGIVEHTNLFTITESLGNNMLVSPEFTS